MLHCRHRRCCRRRRQGRPRLVGCCVALVARRPVALCWAAGAAVRTRGAAAQAALRQPCCPAAPAATQNVARPCFKCVKRGNGSVGPGCWPSEGGCHSVQPRTAHCRLPASDHSIYTIGAHCARNNQPGLRGAGADGCSGRPAAPPLPAAAFRTEHAHSSRKTHISVDLPQRHQRDGEKEGCVCSKSLARAADAALPPLDGSAPLLPRSRFLKGRTATPAWTRPWWG